MKGYENFKLIAEYKWGDETWGSRKEAARDSGILIHSIGEDGAYGGVWMYALEVQIIEGGTGDFIVVGDGGDRFSLTATVAEEYQGSSPVFQEGGKDVTVNKGRINWWGRDPDWEDTLGFRGDLDVEHPILDWVGDWNRLEITAKGDAITVYLNGVLVNRATEVRPTKGRIQVQSEGAEIFFRKLDLIPLE